MRLTFKKIQSTIQVKGGEVMLCGAVSFEKLIKFMSERNINYARNLCPGLKSLIVFIFPYYTDDKDGNLGRYARFKDYHSVLGAILGDFTEYLKEINPEYIFFQSADNSPINEKAAAALCGLGSIGKNQLLINETYGSYVFIGCILTNMPLRSAERETDIFKCSECGECVRACPTGALSDGGFDKSLCLSYLTQKKGGMSEAQLQILKAGKTIWGCDLCQEVCPKNRGIQKTGIKDFKENLIYSLDADILENMPDDVFENFVFSFRGRDFLYKRLVERL